MTKLFGGIYKNKRVLITGHTGFKGSWLSFWLKKLGAKVFGLGLVPSTQPNHFDLLQVDTKGYIQDICDLEKVKALLQQINPEIIFHLAAQPLVQLSYKEPVQTYMTNIMGTINLLEATRSLSDIKAIVIITSDKCYENKEWIWGYRENEAMGGKDPYSSSKGCVELITEAYRNSFFNNVLDKTVLVASARAGNVIGGGDWAPDRILTDIVTAASLSFPVLLRSPSATRPWQYVLEPLSGYLSLGWNLLSGRTDFAGAWNFGPNIENNVSVLELVKEAQKSWERIKFDFDEVKHAHEAKYLMLDSHKSIHYLEWRPVWGFTETVAKTIEWYRVYYENGIILSERILNEYVSDAMKKDIKWSRI